MHDTSGQDPYCELWTGVTVSCRPAVPAQADCAGDWPASSPRLFRICLHNRIPTQCRDWVDPVEEISVHVCLEEFQS